MAISTALSPSSSCQLMYNFFFKPEGKSYGGYDGRWHYEIKRIQSGEALPQSDGFLFVSQQLFEHFALRYDLLHFLRTGQVIGNVGALDGFGTLYQQSRVPLAPVGRWVLIGRVATTEVDECNLATITKEIQQLKVNNNERLYTLMRGLFTRATVCPVPAWHHLYRAGSTSCESP